MAEIHPFPGAENVEREASEWIARLNAEDLTEQDRIQFESWRSAHPRHARAYEELAATWDKFTAAGRLVRAVNLGQALEESTQNAIRQAAPAAGGENRFNVRRFSMLAAAALTAFAIGLGWVLLSQSSRTLFQTAIGEHAAIELPDGSTLELNSNSLARVDFSESARVIRLVRGEAFFRVEHDTTRPFWVLAGNSWVRAVGTAFNVHLLPEGVRVLVSEGAVKVAATAPSSGNLPSDRELARVAVSVLKAGQQLDVQGAATELQSLAPVEITRAVAWRTGTVYFESAPLGRVVDELGRYSTLQVVIEDAALRDIQVGGTFQANAQGTEALLKTLRDGFRLQVRRDGRTAYVSSNDTH
jgi:transmembrane sensor